MFQTSFSSRLQHFAVFSNPSTFLQLTFPTLLKCPSLFGGKESELVLYPSYSYTLSGSINVPSSRPTPQRNQPTSLSSKYPISLPTKLWNFALRCKFVFTLSYALQMVPSWWGVNCQFNVPREAVLGKLRQIAAHAWNKHAINRINDQIRHLLLTRHLIREKSKENHN